MPMCSGQDIGGLTVEEALDPPYCHISYKEETAVFTFAIILRWLWKLQPPAPQAQPEPGAQSTTNDDEAATEQGSATSNSLTMNDVMAQMGPLSRMTPEERENLPKYLDKDDWQSEYRRHIAYLWNHPFYDVTSFLWRVN